MGLRVLMGALLAGLLALAAAGAVAQDGAPLGAPPVESLEAIEIPIPGGDALPAQGEPAPSVEDTASDSEPDQESDPAVVDGQEGLEPRLELNEGPARRHLARCVPGRPPVPPPKLREAITHLSANLSAVGSGMIGSKPPQHAAFRKTPIHFLDNSIFSGALAARMPAYRAAAVKDAAPRAAARKMSAERLCRNHQQENQGG